MLSKSAGSANLLEELQTVLTHGTIARRIETLQRVTDLFLNQTVDYSDDQITLFDDVFNCLIHHIESSAKALLARRLAPVAKAPPQIIHVLAFDDLIEVAAPVLSQSERLSDDVLIESVRSKSQAHLLAISTRRVLSVAVTDVLIERGNDEVVKSTVNNPGADFSELGFTQLVERAEGNDDIATCVGMRRSIPRHHYLKLIAKASAAVRARLAAANPDLANDVSVVVSEVTRRARSAPGTISRETTIAHGLVRSLYEDGRLDEQEVAAFAEARKFDETNAAIACLANVSIADAEKMMIESQTEGVLILAKVGGLSWATAKTIIDMRRDLTHVEMTDINAAKQTYECLRQSTAQQVLRFHRTQQAAATGDG